MKKIITFLFILLISTNLAFSMNERNGSGYKVLHKWEGIYVVEIDGSKVKDKLHPVVSYTTPTELFNSGKYSLVVNGGFFDMQTGDAVSYVTIDGVEVESPYNNKTLMENLEAQQRLVEVLDRSELRILESKNGKKISFEISRHSSPIPPGFKLRHSIQGGPSILPKCDMEEESFIKYDDKGNILFESASVLKRRPRTLVGIKKDKLYIIVYTRSAKTTIPDTTKFLKKKLKLKSAMGLDGGGSTSLMYNDVKIISEGEDGRPVKSFLVIEE